MNLFRFFSIQRQKSGPKGGNGGDDENSSTGSGDEVEAEPTNTPPQQVLKPNRVTVLPCPSISSGPFFTHHQKSGPECNKGGDGESSPTGSGDGVETELAITPPQQAPGPGLVCTVTTAQTAVTTSAVVSAPPRKRARIKVDTEVPRRRQQQQKQQHSSKDGSARARKPNTKGIHTTPAKPIPMPTEGPVEVSESILGRPKQEGNKTSKSRPQQQQQKPPFSSKLSARPPPEKEPSQPRATPATPSPTGISARSVADGSPVILTLPAAAVTSVTSAGQSVGPRSTDLGVLCALPSRVPPSSSEASSLDEDAHRWQDTSMMELEDDVLFRMYDFADDVEETGVGVAAAGSGRGVGAQASGSKSGCSNDGSVHDVFGKGQPTGVVVQPLHFHHHQPHYQPPRRPNTAPTSSRAVQLCAERAASQQSQWTCQPRQRPLSPSVVAASDSTSSLHTRAAMTKGGMVAVPAGGGGARECPPAPAGRPGNSGHNRLIYHTSGRCTATTATVGGGTHEAREGVDAPQPVSRGGGKSSGGEFYSTMTLETAEAISATLVEVMGGAGVAVGSSGSKLCLFDDMYTQQPQQAPLYGNGGGGGSGGGASAGSFWHRQRPRMSNSCGTMIGFTGDGGMFSSASVAAASAAAVVTAIPPTPRVWHPATVGTVLQRQQLHHTMFHNRNLAEASFDASQNPRVSGSADRKLAAL